MGKLLSIVDRLTNIMSGAGTVADKRSAAFYSFAQVTPQEAEAAYRSSWIMRKIVDIPPFDMTREWRDWQAEKDVIEKIEAEERRLKIKAKCQRALVLSRLFGGSALILGTGESDTTQPINVGNIGQGGLKYVHVMSRHQLGEGQPRTDPADPWFGQPQFFTLTTSTGQTLDLHPSRVVTFIGQRVPEGSFYPSMSWFWGDPLMQSIGEVIKNAEGTQNAFASLPDEAKVDIIKIPDLLSKWSTDANEKQFMARLNAAALGKSNWRMLAIDGAEEWDQKELSWTGIPETMLAFMDMVAGAADIPLTRLLGQSPRGLQSTGDGEARDYHAMVKARQEEQLSPALDQIDELLIRSALGSKPTDVYYEFGSLEDSNEKDEATIEFQFAQATSLYANTGLLPDEALGAIVRNRIIESGRWPGSESAFEEADANAAANPTPDESDLQTLEQRVAAMEQKGTITKPMADAILADAAPRTLYVSRKLLNADAVIAWAKEQGFATTLTADQMHVTVLYSRTPVDWMEMGQASDWSYDPADQRAGITRVPPGGPRMLDRFGSLKNAVVLLFNSSSLCWRHEQMIQMGASSDYEDYAPHVTISYDVPADLDLDAVEPYRGELVFGPEIFEEVQEGWQNTIEEE